MNKISKSVYALAEVYRKAGLEVPFDTKQMIDELTENSYKNNAIENLVKVYEEEMTVLDISDYTAYEDYEVLTSTRTDDEGNEWYREEDYQEYIKKSIAEKFEKYKVVEDTEDDEVVFHLITDEGDLYDTYSDMADLETDLESLKSDFEEEFTDWDYLDYQYDEICYNYVHAPSYGVDIDSAQDAGLGVLELNGDKYLFLQGGGMDMSFQFVKYFAYAEKALPTKYLDRLEWTKLNSSKEEFKNVLECLGVDTSRLSNIEA